MHLSVPSVEIAPLRALAVSAGGSAEIPDAGAGDMPLGGYFQLLQHLSLRLRDETCQFSSRPLLIGATDFVLDTLKTANDLEGAMRHIARAYNLLHGGGYNRVERRRDRIAYVIDDRGFPHVQDRDSRPALATMEGVLIFLHALLSLAAGVDLTGSLRTVRIRRAVRHPTNGLLHFWTASVRCASAVYAVEYDISCTALPVRDNVSLARAAEVYETALAMIARRERASLTPGFPTRVRNAIAGGVHEQKDVARMLGVSAATLRRRLAEGALSFRDIRAQALNDAARAMLEDGRSSADIAEALGFADLRSFARAFKAWNGTTPAGFASAIRRNAEKPAPARA